MAATVRLVSRLDDIARGMAAKGRAQDLAAANRIAADMRRRVPVRTGELQESIEAHPTAEGAVVTADFPWRQVEYGTVKMAAQPFATPAVEAERPGFIRALGRALLG